MLKRLALDFADFTPELDFAQLGEITIVTLANTLYQPQRLAFMSEDPRPRPL